MTKLERILLHSAPVRLLTAWSKRTVLPGFEGIPVYDAGKFFILEIKKDRIVDRAASIAFFFLLAIPPTFIFLFTLLPLFPLRGLEHTIYGILHDISPNYNSFILIRNVIHDFLHTQRNGLLSFSFLMGVITSSAGVLSIMRSFDKSYPGYKKRKFFQRRWTALKINTLLILSVILSMSLIVAQRIMFRYIFEMIGFQNEAIRLIINIVRWLIIILLFFAIFSFIYTYGPSVKKRWRFLSAGSALATALTIVTTLGFSYYVNHFGSYNRIYGSIGTIIVLMVWVYINSLILLVGFELNASIRILKGKMTGTASEAVKAG